MELKILYEDEDIVAVDKPTGLVTHSDGRTKEETAEDWFKEKYPENTGGYVHRLDRDTSGVLVFAKNGVAYEFLRKAFHDREIQKTYLAIVYGALKAKKGVIDFDIGRSRKNFRLRSAQPKAKGRLRDAVTNYEVIGEEGEYSLLKISPETGRTHQIRVHLKAIHHPIIEDVLYSPKQKGPLPFGLDRLALHAHTLNIPLISGVHILITAPIPDDLAPAVEHFPDAAKNLLS
jgi:23S rRNA pseudouridine1911/1915/1917 synthase